jgi:hypothetical protein
MRPNRSSRSMPSHTRLLPWRAGLGAVLAILAGIVWFVLISQALLELLPPHASACGNIWRAGGSAGTGCRGDSSRPVHVLAGSAPLHSRGWTGRRGESSGSAAVSQLACAFRRCWFDRDRVDGVGPDLCRADATLAVKNQKTCADITFGTGPDEERAGHARFRCRRD